ncbi:NAD-dependent dehydratase [Brevibacterium spongiae]|uniref:NAD-dependent dehydratase n=1 Tax=Brevibacterium spongiae TaxID=2909672 RepID=A0ABY5SLW9_9MICO|nr:NAD-dependent dehydratase [Brevibacterium spongiae]UVI35260.1 NAD-dependent dehydratase [Brevibacterium spongiae]
MSTTNGRRILLAGCGDLGTRLGLRLVDQGHKVIGLRRRVAELPDAFETISLDLSLLGSPERGGADAPVRSDLRLDALDAVVITLTPDEPTRAGYERSYLHGLRGLARVLESQPGRVVLVSSTRVLADDPTRVTTEDTPSAPESGPGEVLTAAESEAGELFDHVTIVRPAGIYGPGRTRLIDSVRRGQQFNHQRWTNRIHRDDLVHGLEHLALDPEPPNLVHAVDSQPAQMGEVAAFIADRLGVPVPDHIEDEKPGGKRIDGTRFRALVGELGYPTYRDGFSSMLTATA